MTSNMLCANGVAISCVPSDFMINSLVSFAALFKASLYTTALQTVDPLSLLVAPVEVDGVTVVIVIVVAAVAVL